MRYSMRTLMRLAERALPPERVPAMVFCYKGSKKRYAVSASEMFAAFAESGATAYSWCAAIDGYQGTRESKLIDILCQLVNGAENIPVVPADNKQIHY